ncbi:MAG: rRNA maturation RNase YbeY [Pseudomonadota bacterium]
MPVETVIEDERWQALGLAALSDRAFAAVLAQAGLRPGAFDATILGCDDARIAALNDRFRGKAQPTNVLSWPGADRAPGHPGAVPAPPDPLRDAELGDIAIAYETCVREAGTQSKSVEDHVMHLLVHGLLHLLGYDHIRDADASVMEETEIKILGKMGISDPY